MKNLCEMKKGITHSSKFHTDDVISTAFLRFFSPELIVERVDEFDREEAPDEIVYDIGLGEFDHHQEEPRMDENGVPYCAFGLLWEAYGRQYLEGNGFTYIDDAFDVFKRSYVNKMNYGDNHGYRGVRGFAENAVIIKCNPLWYEEKEDPASTERQFEKAVKLGEMFLKNWTRRVFDIVEEHSYCVGEE